MAYTQGCLDLNAATGKSAVYLVDPANPTDDAPLSNPTAHRNRVLFHSDWDYLEVVYDHSSTLSLPTRSTMFEQSYSPLPNHNIGSIPFGFGIVSGSVLTPNSVIQRAGTWSRRCLSVSFTTTGITFHEQASVAVLDGDVLPSISVPVRCILLGYAAANKSEPFDINPGGGYIQLGYGKFNSSGNRKLRVTSRTSVFRFFALGATMDSVNAALRIAKPDGSVVNIGGYSGTFVPPPSVGVTF